MKRFFKRFRYGEKGFTLIELLVVVAILGVLAAVMVPNVGRFMGRGILEAANTEVANVQLAVISAMVDTDNSQVADLGALGTGGTVGPGHASAVYESDGATEILVWSYFTGTLEATYTLNTDGSIASAEATLDGKWKDLTYDDDDGWSETSP